MTTFALRAADLSRCQNFTLLSRAARTHAGDNAGGAFQNMECSLCRNSVSPDSPEVGEKKKRLLGSLIRSVDQVVCRKCYSAARLNQVDQVSSVSVRDDVVNLGKRCHAGIIPASAVDTLNAARNELIRLDSKIAVHLQEIEALQFAKNDLGRQVDDTEREFAVALAEEYPERRRRANRVISKRILRMAIFHRDGGCCVKCKSRYALSVDHIDPVIKGGTDDFDNLQTLCKPCNSRKGGK